VACKRRRGPRTFILYCHSKSAMVISEIGVFLDTPALLTSISIWNFPVSGCEKWVLVILMILSAPAFSETSACMIRHLTPCFSSRLLESSVVRAEEESEV